MKILLITFALCAGVSSRAIAQADDHDEHDHHHDYLHFSHPMLTESPSPDTKLRFDYGRDLRTLANAVVDNFAKLEAEYAFSRAVSLSVTSVYDWKSPDRDGFRANANSLEVALKGADFRWSKRGVLAGGGVSFDIPLAHSVAPGDQADRFAIEPFADVAMRRGDLELVALGAYSTTVNRVGNRERQFRITGSALEKISPRIELLAEAETVRPVSGISDNRFELRLAPGFKVRPFTDKDLAFGASAPIGIGVEKSRSLFLSAFYHF